MKWIGLSQRVVAAAEYVERRDALDQRWSIFLEHCGFLAYPLPNHPEMVLEICRRMPLDGIVLTGGNNLVEYGGDAPERDATERILLEWAENTDLPVIGVCRGMQMIQHYYGGTLQPVAGHSGACHGIVGDGPRRVVNSFHTLAVGALPNNLAAEAAAEDGIVESLRHTSAPILGMMWHPERCSPFEPADVTRFVDWFGNA